MILEITILLVKNGKTSAFERDFEIASKYISSVPGYIRHTLHKCLEHDHKYVLQVEWQTLEDHTIGFRKSEIYTQWKKLLHHYYDPFPTVEHFQQISI